MIITVAGNKKEYKDGLTVAELIEAEKIDNPLYVTVSVNEEFVELLTRPCSRTVIASSSSTSWEAAANGIY